MPITAQPVAVPLKVDGEAFIFLARDIRQQKEPIFFQSLCNEDEEFPLLVRRQMMNCIAGVYYVVAAMALFQRC